MNSKKPSVRGRILALDLGDKRIGVAICDELQISISPLPAIAVTNWKTVLNAIQKTAAEFDAVAVVLGWPLNLDGSEGFQVEEVRKTGEKLVKSLELPIFYQDERLTSVAAEEQLRDLGVPQKKRKGLVDSRAASIILSEFISMLRD
jgi:putative Holliday junction resolvase